MIDNSLHMDPDSAVENSKKYSHKHPFLETTQHSFDPQYLCAGVSQELISFY